MKIKIVSSFALTATFFAFIVIALGAFTRLVDAGLGCPDWPGCYGNWIVSATSNTQIILFKAWAEMIHRYAVGGLSLFIMSIIFLILWKNRKPFNLILITSLILLLIYQILLGRWTITLKLSPIIVSQHLIGGFLILSALWLIYLNNKAHYQKRESLKLFSWTFIALILLFTQIFLGAWTSTNYASLACTDFPFCINLQPTQTLSSLQMIHMMHRVGALLISGYFLIFMMIAMMKLKNHPDLMRILFLMVMLLIIQICLGMANVMLKLPVLIAVLHTITAAALLLCVITFAFKLIYKRQV